MKKMEEIWSGSSGDGDGDGGSHNHNGEHEFSNKYVINALWREKLTSLIVAFCGGICRNLIGSTTQWHT